MPVGLNGVGLSQREVFSRGLVYWSICVLEIVATCGYNSYMTSVSIRDARNHFTELVRRAESGERITVTRYGKPVLDMVPTQRKGGLNLEAGEAYLRSKGIEPRESWISPDFDDPLPEDFLLQPLPDTPQRKLG